jgi:hypothetical protein
LHMKILATVCSAAGHKNCSTLQKSEFSSFTDLGILYFSQKPLAAAFTVYPLLSWPIRKQWQNTM